MIRVRRRHTLTVATAVVAVTVVPVVPSFATEVAPPETVTARMEDLPEAAGRAGADGPSTSEPVLADVPFSMIGFELPAGADEVEVRSRDLDGAWSDWETLGVEVVGLDGPDPGSPEAEAANDGVTEPLWVSDADAFQVRLDGEVGDVAATVIDTEGHSETVVAAAWRHLTARPVVAPAEAAAARPAIITRAQWGADERLRKASPSYATPTYSVVHHTAGSNTYTKDQSASVVRGIYHYHVQSNGWSDIGYNFLVDRFGRIFEGRYGGVDRGVVGAHAAYYNTGSIGVSVLGNHETVDITTAALDGVAKVVAWKYGVHGIDAGASRTVTVRDRTIGVTAGHRDVGSTACPGRYVYAKMGTLRTKIANLASVTTTSAPRPAKATPVPGDWNGDGRTQPGWFANGRWYLPIGAGGATQVVAYGRKADIPVVGDWNGDGRDGLGIVRGKTWHLRRTPTKGVAEISFNYGRVDGGDRPVVGDWSGNGRDGVGVLRGRLWHLRDTASSGPATTTIRYGRAGDRPVVGDWNADGRDGIGVRRSATFHLRGAKGSLTFDMGRSTDRHVAGNWDARGTDTVGVVRGDKWYISNFLPARPADVTITYAPSSAAPS